MAKEKKYMEILIFLCSIMIMVVSVLLVYKNIYLTTPDGDLYISIADNFIRNGHFIQTARPHERNMVVPPGLPLILTGLKLIVNNIYFVVMIQYILFGMSNVFLYKACNNLIKNKVAGIIAVLIYIFSLLADGVIPSYVLTETYVLFVLTCCIWIVSELAIQNISVKKGYISLFLLLLLVLLIRPLMVVCFVPFGVYTICLVKKKKIEIKTILGLGLIAIVLLAMNVLINYRETNEFVLVENYSAAQLYQANNPTVKNESDFFKDLEEMGDERFWDIYYDETLDSHQKNELIKAETTEYIKNNINLVIGNSLKKFKIVFIDHWGKSFEIMLVSMVFLCLKYKKQWYIYVGGVITMLLIALPTSYGLVVWRFSAPVLPLYTCYKAMIIGEVCSFLKRKWDIIS